MRMTRRELFFGAGVGAVTMLLASCAPEPAPTVTPTATPDPLPSTAVPAPAASLRSTWATDPFSRGAVSYTRIGVQSQTRETLAEPVEERLFFAGEATDATAPGTLRGAVRSGDSAAMRLRAAAEPGERIAVVGAGLAGAAAVKRLLGSDLDITVFEARDRLGGRTHSHLDDDWGVPVQLGGWLLPADADPDPETDADAVGRLGLDASLDTADLASALWRSPEGDIDAPTDEPLVAAIAAAQALTADISLAEALTETGSDPEDPALAALLTDLATTAGADADLLSSWFPPALPAAAREGIISDFGAMIAEMLGDAQVSLSSAVTRIAYDDTGVSLRLGTGESTSFDRVIVTVPLGVLQREGIEFAPALPFSHRGAMNALGMGHAETIWLRYDEPFWQTDAVLWHTVGGEHLIRTWINLHPVTGESILIGLVGGSAAEKFADLDEDDALIAALTALEAYLPAADTD
ncbi:flavin monoamine oxidase family protein [Microbacterium sp. GXF6406]